MKNGEHPAFPYNGTSLGISKRDYFAAMALQGILANSSSQSMSNQYPASELGNEERIRLAIDHADEMLRQLEL